MFIPKICVTINRANAFITVRETAHGYYLNKIQTIILCMQENTDM